MSDQDKFLLYTAPDGAVKVDVYFRDETVWLTQKALAELFGVQRPSITKHLGNIFASGELAEISVCSILEHTARDGKTYSAKYYNLDAIIAVGYRVNSYQATQFRIWATRTLREFVIKASSWTTSASSRASGPSARITSTSCWNASGKSGRASGAFTRRSPTSAPFRWITAPPRR